jgi:hypothetical protein
MEDDQTKGRLGWRPQRGGRSPTLRQRKAPQGAHRDIESYQNLIINEALVRHVATTAEPLEGTLRRTGR